MRTDKEYRVVLVAAPRGREAGRLARGLVESRLAACVSVVPGVVSHYRWEGKARRDSESLLVVKTTFAKLQALELWVKARHSYSVPEIVVLAVSAGSKEYLRWLSAQVR